LFLKLFTNEKGMAKLEIGLCRGKKLMTSANLKEQDTKRDRIKDLQLIIKCFSDQEVLFFYNN
jgi:tmRNA-binding protein